MTVSTTKNRINQLADGIQTVFIYDFIVQEESQMKVYFDDVLQSTGYTVNGVGDDAGGDVTFDVAPADGVTITLQRLVDETQLVDYLPYDPFPAETHEDALDKLTLITQQNSDLGERAVTAPVSDDGTTDYTMPVYNSGKGIMWDEIDKKFTNSDDDLNGITADAQASADAAAVSEGNTSTSEGNAATSETNSSASEAKAQEWAENPEDVPVEAGEFSALHWAAKAESSAGTAADLASPVLGTDTYTATLGVSSYTTGRTYYLSFANTNTVAAPTLEFDLLGAKIIKNLNGLALADGAIPDEGFVRYDGTDMILLNPVIVSDAGFVSSQFGGEYIKLSDVKTSGTDGGDFTAGAWQTRVLNTEDTDTGGNASLSSNQFTLQAGTYQINARAPAYQVNDHKLKLRNISDSTDEIIGTSNISANTAATQVYGVVVGQFTITAPKIFELQHYCQTTRTSLGFGVNTTFGVSEVYAIVELWRVK